MAYDAPGVYIRYLTDGPLTVRAASTSTAVFIGPTVIGKSITITGTGSVVVKPEPIDKATDYADRFSTPGARSGVVSLAGASEGFTDHMGHAVRGFFMNGGQRAFIVSTSTGTPARASTTLKLTMAGGENAYYEISALSDGSWGNDITVKAKQSPISGAVDLDIELALEGDEAGKPVDVVERIIGKPGGELADTLSGIVKIVKIEPAPATATPGIELDLSVAPGTPPAWKPVSKDAKMVGGKNSRGTNASPTLSTEFDAIFQALRDVDDISIIVLPGRIWPADHAEYSLALKHCQACKDRLTLIQLDDATTDFGGVSVPKDMYAAVYFPSARITLPTPGGGQRSMERIGTTGHVAGIYARVDGQSGPWTAPAGVHAAIAGVTELSRDISQTYQERMNKNNINALRDIDGIPTVWGARTRDMGGIYEYVPIMRTAFLIADSLREALNRVVFAKNTEVLWGNVKAGVTSFMDGLFLQGAFQGATPGQSFRIAVGLGESMTQKNIRDGLLKLNVAFAPAVPAEFIEITIEQIFEPG